MSTSTASSVSGLAKIPRPPLKSLIDHIDHIAKVAGIDHVGLGSDFDGVSGATPQGIDSAADLPKITQALLDRGYSADDIKKILGGNLMRVFREVERVSHEMQARRRPPQSRLTVTIPSSFVSRGNHRRRLSYNATLRRFPKAASPGGKERLCVRHSRFY